MEFFRTMDPQKKRVLKAAGLIALAIIVFAGIVSIIQPSPYGPMARRDGMYGMGAPSATFDVAYEKAQSGTGLSMRNIMPPVPPSQGGTTGDDAEAYEVTDYSATIESRNVEETCDTIVSIKARDYVIFENSSSYERGCHHTFKVKKANVPEILEFIKGLDPREVTENTRTIKSLVEDFTSETDILKKKLEAIDQTMKNALLAYDEITSIATKANDAGSLAKIIDSKVQMIERLTNERLRISSELERYARMKAQELDKLEYTYFRVSVYENKYVDGLSIKDSWKEALRNFVFNVNRLIQELSIGLIEFALVLGRVLVYLAIIVFVAKYAWRIVKGFWVK